MLFELPMMEKVVRRTLATTRTALLAGCWIAGTGMLSWAGFCDPLVRHGVPSLLVAILSVAVQCAPPLVWVIWGGARHRATFGMRCLGLRFAGSDQGDLSDLVCALRIAVGVLALVAFPISVCFWIVDPRHRWPPDWLLGTDVFGYGDAVEAH
jgi:hypothetical protein